MIAAENLRDAIDTATALVDDAGAEEEAFAGTGIVITGSVVTAGAARTLFGVSRVTLASTAARGAETRPVEKLPWCHARHADPGGDRGVAGVAGGRRRRRRADPGSSGISAGSAAVLIVLAGLQGRSWAIWADVAVQLIPIAGFVIYPGLGFIGLLFAAVWGADRLRPV